MPNSKPFNAVTVKGKNIHKLIAELVKELSALRWATSVPTEREGIDYLIKLLNKQSLALLATEVDTNSETLVAAATALKDATKAADEAVEKLDGVAGTLAKVAKVVKLIDQALGIVGPFLL